MRKEIVPCLLFCSTSETASTGVVVVLRVSLWCGCETHVYITPKMGQTCAGSIFRASGFQGSDVRRSLKCVLFDKTALTRDPSLLGPFEWNEMERRLLVLR